MEFKYKAAGMSHIIDDFLFVVPPKSNKCLQDLNAFLTLFPKIEISIKDEKTVLPTTVITIYGIEVDSIQMECRLPLDKIQKINNLLYKVQHKKKISLRKLQSLIGLLNFACLVVCPGRAFLRRLIDHTKKVSSPCYLIRFTCEARADLQAWKMFMNGFNGKSIFLKDGWENSKLLTCTLMHQVMQVLLLCSAVGGLQSHGLTI